MSATNAHASSSKHHKHHKSEDKHKSKRGEKSDKSDKKTKHHKDGSSSSSKSYQHRTCRMRMSIPPKYSGDWTMGVIEILDGMLIR
jgi:DNA-directed RNA polymerase I subunit RPA43